jgi:hypothetical protein
MNYLSIRKFHIYIYIYIHVHIYIYTHKYKYTHIFINTYIYIYIYTYIWTAWSFSSEYTAFTIRKFHIHTYTNTYKCTYICIYIQTHIYTHIYINTYIYELPDPSVRNIQPLVSGNFGNFLLESMLATTACIFICIYTNKDTYV